MPGRFLLVCLFSALAVAQGRNPSGGPIRPEQGCFDVQHVRIVLGVDPGARTIEGECTLTLKMNEDAPTLLFDLDAPLKVRAVKVDGRPTPFERKDGTIRVRPPMALKTGSVAAVTIAYGGKPRVAVQAPWDGGFTFAETPDGAPWITTTCQGEGADLWWPCKDHPSDEPESADLVITVPAPLVVASNGRLESMQEDGGLRTYHWRVSTPINNYAIALNIAPYVEIKDTYESAAGDTFPVVFYALPGSAEKAKALLPEIKDHLRFFEEHFGPYPFRADKYGVAETPHLGMEHQTIIAYGYRFARDAMGYDWLHHHELSHEWFGNLVTARDWNDFWLHEGLGTYTQALYIETKRGEADYRREMAKYRRMIAGRRTLAPREPKTTREMSGGDNDIYMKGACVLHTLRGLIGKDALLQAMRAFTYPDPALEAKTDGSACRHATTDEFQAALEKASGRKLDWFFEVYVRSPGLPRLIQKREGGSLSLRWETHEGLDFPMPVEVQVGDEVHRVAMEENEGRLKVPEGAEVVVDPRNEVLRAFVRGNR